MTDQSSGLIVKLFPADKPLGDDTEFAFVDGYPFVNAAKHEQVVMVHVDTADRLRAENEALRMERDRAVETRENANAVSVRVEAEIERLKTSLALFAERIERDRREPDKLLCYVLDMRRVADWPALDEGDAT